MAQFSPRSANVAARRERNRGTGWPGGGDRARLRFRQTGRVAGTSCAWCGSTPLTREHLVPFWLGEVLADAFGDNEGYDFGFEFIDSDGSRTTRSHPQRRPEVVVKAVCEECNNGWMSSLEGQVRPFLEPMVRGGDARLAVADQVALARWAAKVAVLLDHYEDGAIVLGHDDLRQIYRDGIAPPSYHMRLAFRPEPGSQPFDFYVSGHHAAPTGTTDLEAPTAPNSFSVTLALGHVVIAIVGGPGMENHERWARGSDFPLMIWPPTPDGISWPPHAPVVRDRDGLRQFHESFWTGILNPEFPRPDALAQVERWQTDDT